MGLVTGALTFPLAYYFTKRIADRNQADHPGRRAAIVSGVLSALAAYGGYAGTRRRDGTPYANSTDYSNAVLGAPGSNEWGASFKGASDWAGYLNAPVSKGVLLQGVDELPANDPQKAFLNDGIRLAPGGRNTTLWGLGDGFGQAVDTYTGSLLGHAARAVEGALIGGAFGALMGLSPKNRLWAAGIGAVADSLKGSEFYNALGDLRM